jgi:hypothetical protein
MMVVVFVAIKKNRDTLGFVVGPQFCGPTTKKGGGDHKSHKGTTKLCRPQKSQFCGITLVLIINSNDVTKTYGTCLLVTAACSRASLLLFVIEV